MLQPHKVRIALRPVASKIRARASRPTTNGQMPFKVERVFFTLRWLTIALAVAIQLYSATNASKTESFVTALLPTALVAIYNGLFMSLRYGLADRRVVIWLSGLDALVIAFAIGETGGIYSPFLLLLYLVVVESAFNFSPNNALTFTAFIGAVYTVAAMFISGQVWNELTITIVMGEVMLMFILVTISSSMVNALEHQKGLVQRERELSAQLNRQVKALSSLNRLSERLHASLEIEELMQRTVEALPEALEVAACVAFLARRDDRDEWQVSASWYGIDEEFEPFDQPQSGNIQAGPLVLERVELDRVIEGGEILRLEQEGGEAILVVPLRPDDCEGGALALLRQTGPAFAESDLELLAALGRQMSLLIKNARLYEQEKQNVVRLQELETMKSDFLSVVSHELRTPITSIKASNILMMTQPDGEVSDRDMRLLKNIDRNTERLNGLVSDLLDMAKLQHGRVKLSLLPHALTDIAAEVVGCVRPLADSKGQRLEIEAAGERGEVLADRRRLEQIITNLVSNAVRYTPKGGHIYVKLFRQNTELVLSVQDDGPGIASHEQELIWERFYRVPQQASKTGTGLGLAIARSLVELHGGRIWLDSLPGRGSTFSFALPIYTPKLVEPIKPNEGQLMATAREQEAYLN